jgi:rod shape-determining protein MreD
MLSVIAWPLPFLGTVSPPLALVCIYYWTVHRPDLFGAGSAFVIGLLNDIINDLPLGLSAFVYIGVQHVILRQRRFFVGHSFFALWMGFVLTVVIVLIVQMLLLSLVRWQWMPFTPVFMQMILVIVLFPLPCWLFIRLQRLILPQG